MTSEAAVLHTMFSLDGRRALVTGASRGLGKAMAGALAAAGADVVCASSSPGGASQTAASIRAMGRTAWELDADLADNSAVAALAKEAQRVAGHIDILVNNAGSIARFPALQHSVEEWDRVLRTNLDAAFILSQAVGDAMIARG